MRAKITTRFVTLFTPLSGSISLICVQFHLQHIYSPVTLNPNKVTGELPIIVIYIFLTIAP